MVGRPSKRAKFSRWWQQTTCLQAFHLIYGVNFNSALDALCPKFLPAKIIHKNDLLYYVYGFGVFQSCLPFHVRAIGKDIEKQIYILRPLTFSLPTNNNFSPVEPISQPKTREGECDTKMADGSTWCVCSKSKITSSHLRHDRPSGSALTKGTMSIFQWHVYISRPLKCLIISVLFS